MEDNLGTMSLEDLLQPAKVANICDGSVTQLRTVLRLSAPRGSELVVDIENRVLPMSDQHQ
jgi:hypothetical protein